MKASNVIFQVKNLYLILLLSFGGYICAGDMPDNGDATPTPDNINQTILLEPTREENDQLPLLKLPDWLVYSAIENAPTLVQGMVKYWMLPMHDMNTPAAHRLILVGEPGTGKTTLAYAIGRMLDCRTTYIPASSFVGSHRNETAVRIKNFFNKCKKEKVQKRIIIIDELHKILEHYDNEHYDTSETAAALWLALDELENYYPHIIVIATMNSAIGIPPEIKSRFHGKIATIAMPIKKQKLDYFRQMLECDYDLKLDKSVNNKFIKQLATNADNFSLRDFQALIDTAQMFAFSRANTLDDLQNVVITADDFTLAMIQLTNETRDHDQQLFEKWYPAAKKIACFTGAALNAYAVAKIIIKTTFISTPRLLYKIGIIE